MNHYLINKNRTSYGCNVTKDKNFKKKYIFFFTISQQQIQIPLKILHYYYFIQNPRQARYYCWVEY